MLAEQIQKWDAMLQQQLGRAVAVVPPEGRRDGQGEEEEDEQDREEAEEEEERQVNASASDSADSELEAEQELRDEEAERVEASWQTFRNYFHVSAEHEERLMAVWQQYVLYSGFFHNNIPPQHSNTQSQSATW